MIRRVTVFLVALVKALNILACTLIYGPLYIVGLADEPTGRRFISSYVGRAKFNGHAWARPVAALIDRGAMLLGDRPDHCVRTYLYYRGRD